MVFGDYLLPLVETTAPGLSNAVAASSLVPKAAASFAGAHLYVPFAHWFWKLTLLPALPISFSLSIAIMVLSDYGTSKEAIYDDWLPMTPQDTTETLSMAWRPTMSGSKPAATRLREAAPRPVQILLEQSSLKTG